MESETGQRRLVRRQVGGTEYDVRILDEDNVESDECSSRVLSTYFLGHRLWRMESLRDETTISGRSNGPAQPLI